MKAKDVIIVNTATRNMNKAVVLFSSPNENGNTKTLYNQFIKNFSFETSFLNLYGLSIAPCTDCKACHKGECPYNCDDMGIVLDEIHKADVIICATPIYFNSVPSPFKALIDRCQQLYVKKIILKKPEFKNKRLGILLTTSGSTDEKAVDNLYHTFSMVFSCFNAEFISHISFKNTDKKSDYDISSSIISNIRRKIQEEIL